MNTYRTMLYGILTLFIFSGCGGGGTSSSSKLSVDYLKYSTLDMNIHLNSGLVLSQVETFTDHIASPSHYGQGFFSCAPSEISDRDFTCYYLPNRSSLIEGYEVSIDTETKQISGEFAYAQNILDFRDKVSKKQFDGVITGEIIK